MTTNKPLYALTLVLTLGLGSFVIPTFHDQAFAQQSCDVREYAEFVAYAQSLHPLAENLGRRMIQCGNRDYRESSFYWLSFYYSMTGKAEKNKSLASLMPRETDTSPKAQSQRSALLGETTNLINKVDTATQGYVDDPWILMTLARSQTNLEQYPLAYANYTRVLKLKEDQDAAEIELLFAYIRAKDTESAENKLAALKRYNPSPYMRQSLERAEKLLRVEKPEHGGERHDFLSLAYVQERDNLGYAALGGRIIYEGPVEIEIEALEHTHPLEAEKEKVADINIAKEWGQEGSLRLLTAIGYYTPGDDHVTGQLGLEMPIEEGIEAKFGVVRRNVSFYERPPAGERAGIMRDSAYWNLGYHERLQFSGAIHREDEKDDATFEDYKIEWKLGSLLDKETDSGFGMIIPLSYRHRPMASQDYRSYPHDFRIGAGVRLGLSDGLKYSLKAEAVVESIHRDNYGNVNAYEKVLGARIKTHMRYYYNRSYYNFFEGSAFIIEKMDYERTDEKSSEFLVGIGVTQAAH